MREKRPTSDAGGEDFWRPDMAMEPGRTFRFRVPIDRLTSRITPNSDIFVMAHFGIPRIDPDKWRLHLSGMLARPCEMTLPDLRAFPKHEIESFIKCAGFPADPTIATRNASNACWAGARLDEVMQAVGLSPDASHLWFYAPDHGTYQDWNADCYIKDLPVSRLSAGDVLLAYEVNGEPLSAEHGFPVRVFIPGFYGTNSVKWLCRIEAASRRAPGIFANELYNDPVVPEAGKAGPATAPVWGVAPEALITSPADHASLEAGRLVVSGWCWGEHPIVKVELSLDSGRNWLSAIPDARYQNSWQGFAFEVFVDKPGRLDISVRATDAKGNTQPQTKARNAIHTINVMVDDNRAGP